MVAVRCGAGRALEQPDRDGLATTIIPFGCCFWVDLDTLSCHNLQCRLWQRPIILDSAVAESRISLKAANLRCGNSLKYRILRSPNG